MSDEAPQTAVKLRREPICLCGHLRTIHNEAETQGRPGQCLAADCHCSIYQCTFGKRERDKAIRKRTYRELIREIERAREPTDQKIARAIGVDFAEFKTATADKRVAERIEILESGYARTMFNVKAIRMIREELAKDDLSATARLRYIKLWAEIVGILESGEKIAVNLNQQNNTVDFETAMRAVREKHDKKAIGDGN